MQRDANSPFKIVEKWRRAIPEIYQALTLMRTAQGEGNVDWPSYCYLPIGAAVTYLKESADLTLEEAASVAAEVTICASWQRNPVLYNIDTYLAYLLLEQTSRLKSFDPVPADVLLTLPNTGIYVRTEAFRDMDGFWAWIEYNLDADITELRLQWVYNDLEHTLPMMLHIVPGATLRDCVLDTLQKPLRDGMHRFLTDQEYEDLIDPLISAMQMIFYILSKEADIEPEVLMSLKTARDGSIRIQKARPGRVKVKKVGGKVGTAMQQSLPPLDPAEQEARWEFAKETVRWLPPPYLNQEPVDNLIVFPGQAK